MYKKMMQRVRCVLCVGMIFSAAFFTGCEKKPHRYQVQYMDLFDTVTTITAYVDSDKQFQECSRYIQNQLREYHQLYDIYQEYEGINNIKTINENAGIQPISVDRRILDLLALAADMDKQTHGQVNVAYGSVLKLWHDKREFGLNNPEEAELPSEQELAAASEHTDIDRVRLDFENSTVFLEDPLMRLDVGAIAKGYAVEQVAQSAEKAGFTSVLLDVGGNIRAIGNKADSGKAWSVGIQNPHSKNASDILYMTALENLSLVTSGDYQRYYTVQGQRYHHIIDPDTHMPAAFFSAVTVICPDSGKADALSTALFNMSLEDGKRLLTSFPGTEAVWIKSDGSQEFSDGFSSYIVSR